MCFALDVVKNHYAGHFLIGSPREKRARVAGGDTQRPLHMFCALSLLSSRPALVYGRDSPTLCLVLVVLPQNDVHTGVARKNSWYETCSWLPCEHLDDTVRRGDSHCIVLSGDTAAAIWANWAASRVSSVDTSVSGMRSGGST